jgi:hypothetical protein
MYQLFFFSVSRERVRDEICSEQDALNVKQYITDMFTTTKDREDRTTVKFKTRDGWMHFLGAAIGKFFNPVFPRHSGNFLL